MPSRVTSCLEPVYYKPRLAEPRPAEPQVTTPRSYFSIAPRAECFDFLHPSPHEQASLLCREQLLQFPVACARVRLSGFFGSFKMALTPLAAGHDFDSSESVSWGRLFFALEDSQTFVQAGDCIQLHIRRREGGTYELEVQVNKQRPAD